MVIEVEDGKQDDRFAVSVGRDGEIVGHMPRSISKVWWHFLNHRGEIKCQVTGRGKKGNELSLAGERLLVLR